MQRGHAPVEEEGAEPGDGPGARFESLRMGHGIRIVADTAQAVRIYEDDNYLAIFAFGRSPAATPWAPLHTNCVDLGHAPAAEWPVDLAFDAG